MDKKILSKILPNQIQQYVKRIIYQDQVGFIPECKKGSICTNQWMWYKTLTKWRIKIIWPPKRCRKSIWQSSTSIYNKKSPQSAYGGTYLNIIKAIYNKPTANKTFNSEKLKAFPLRSGTRQGCPLLPLLFNIVLETYNISTSIRQEKEIKESKLERKN